jgi:uncharacterized protein (TIGR02271 family)
MTDETIVAVYDSAEHAGLAVRELEAAGVPSSAITQHAKDEMRTGSTTTSSTAPARGEGFWSNLFGSGPDHGHDTTVYDRSLEGGSTVVTVKAPEQHLPHVMDILERHNPVDMEERTAAYGANETTTTTRTTTATPLTETAAPVTGTATPLAGTVDRSTDGGGTIQLSEESLAVGKRAINRGTTRVRRFVVETPVEEQVALRDETVSVERHAVTDGSPVSDGAFTDKVIEMTETDEEAVVSKTARVKEEVVIHKDATERVETIHDTVRREDVEITKEPGVERSTTTSGTTPVQPKTTI